MDEYAIYDEIKKAFKPIDGKILMVIVTSPHISEMKVLVLNDIAACEEQVFDNISQKIPYAAFDNLSENKGTYTFRGIKFSKQEILLTGEVLYFTIYSEKPITVEEVRRDFTRISLIFKSSKAT